MPRSVVLIATVTMSTIVAISGLAGATQTRSAPTGDTKSCTKARPANVGSAQQSLVIAGVDREYELSIPRKYDGRKRLPVLLSLHGFTSNIAEQDQASRFPRKAGRRGYIVVTPQALDVDVPLPGGNVKAPLWNIQGAFALPADLEGQALDATDDIGFVHTLLDRLEKRLCIDTRREFVSGISNGAGMTVVLICNDDQRFAGAAPVAGVNLSTICDAQRATPTIAFHGDADPLVEYGGGSIFGYNLGLPSVERRMADFAALGGCDPTPQQTQPFDDIRHMAWDCPEGAAAELYTVVGGGHTWFGARATPVGRAGPQAGTPRTEVEEILGRQTYSIDATDLILDFFDELPGTD